MPRPKPAWHKIAIERGLKIESVRTRLKSGKSLEDALKPFQLKTGVNKRRLKGADGRFNGEIADAFDCNLAMKFASMKLRQSPSLHITE